MEMPQHQSIHTVVTWSIANWPNMLARQLSSVRELINTLSNDPKKLVNSPELLEAWLELTSVNHHINVWVSVLLNQCLVQTMLQAINIGPTKLGIQRIHPISS